VQDDGLGGTIGAQCLTRAMNERAERTNLLAGVHRRTLLRCECGDPACHANVDPTHAEYEDVRAFGARFLVERNHEDPESSCVVGDTAAFSVVEVVAADARRFALGQDGRDAWVGPATPYATGPPTRPQGPDR
jgi:hypothetical protein